MRLLFLLWIVFCFSKLGLSQKVHLYEDFNSGILPSNWTNTAITGSTPWLIGINGATAHTGNTNLNGTNFVYFDDDNLGSSSTNNTVELVTPSFNNAIDSITFLEFDYNYRQLNHIADSFYIEVFDGVNWNKVFIRAPVSDCGSYTTSSIAACNGVFPHAKIDISAYRNSNCQVRFIYHDGNDWGWYIGLDNISITSPFKNDLAVTKITSPVSGCLTDSSIISFVVKNKGIQLSNLIYTIQADINNGNQIISESVTTPINPNDSVIVYFNQKAKFNSIGSNILKVSVNYPNDSDSSNDSIIDSLNFYNIIKLPYIESFEIANSLLWYSSGINSSWQQGVPVGTIIDTAFSGSKIFATNINGNYNNNEQSFLFSPCFDISEDTISPLLSFAINCKSELNQDSLKVEYSIDDGISWSEIPYNNDTIDWYNTSEGFQGNSKGWLKKSIVLDSLKYENQVKFRFALNSNSSIVDEGFGIDAFSLRFQENTDLSLSVVNNYVTNNACVNDSSILEFNVKNIGLSIIDTAYLFVDQNNGLLLKDTVVNSISPNERKRLRSKLKIGLQNGHNTFNAWILVRNDSNTTNDSIFKINFQYSPNSNPVYSFPYQENFDLFSAGTNYNNTNDIIRNDWSRYSNSSFTWRVEDTNTISSSTGPLQDVTGGNYLYSESSLSSLGDLAYLESPCLSMPNDSSVILSFYSHRYGVDIDELAIQIFNGINWRNEIVLKNQFQLSESDSWTFHSKKINIIPNQSLKLRFVAKSSGGIRGDIAIDDIKIFSITDNDLFVEEIISPITSCNLSNSEVVSVKVINNGNVEILPNSVFVEYKINGGNVITELITDTIKVDSSIIHSFSQRVNLGTSKTSYLLSVNTNYILDSLNFNDTNKVLLHNKLSVLGIAEDFESTSTTVCQSSSIGTQELPLYWQIDNGFMWLIQTDSSCNFSSNIQGATESDSTGPAAAYSGNKFLYLEASSLSSGAGKTINLETSCYDLRNQNRINLDFYYHKFGRFMNDLYIDIKDSSGNLITVDSIIGETHTSHSDPWSLKSISLDSFVNQSIQIVFRVNNEMYNVPGNHPTIRWFMGDMALDDVRVYNPTITDLNHFEKESDLFFSLFPNPNNGNFKLKVNKELIGETYQIFGIKGTLVLESLIESSLSQINLNKIEKGIYFLKIKNVGKTEKIVVY